MSDKVIGAYHSVKPKDGSCKPPENHIWGVYLCTECKIVTENELNYYRELLCAMKS